MNNKKAPPASAVPTPPRHWLTPPVESSWYCRECDNNKQIKTDGNEVETIYTTCICIKSKELTKKTTHDDLFNYNYLEPFENDVPW